jgi:hypothetical protein
MRTDCTNHHDNLEFKRYSCAIQYAILDMACTSPDATGNITYSCSSKLSWACRTPDCAKELVSSGSFSFVSPILLSLAQLDHNQKNSKLSHPSLSHHTMNMS